MEECLGRISESYNGCDKEIEDLVFHMNKLVEEKQREWEASYQDLLEHYNKQTHLLTDYKLVLSDKESEIVSLRDKNSELSKSSKKNELDFENKIHQLSQENKRLREGPDKYFLHDFKAPSFLNEIEYYKNKVAEYEVLQTTYNAQISSLQDQRRKLLKKNEETQSKYNQCKKELQGMIDESQEVGSESLLKSKQEEICMLTRTIQIQEQETKDIRDTLEDVLKSNHVNNTHFNTLKEKCETISAENSELKLKINEMKETICYLESEKKNLEGQKSNFEAILESSNKSRGSEVALMEAQHEAIRKENEFLRALLLSHIGSNKTLDPQESFEKVHDNRCKETIDNVATEQEVQTSFQTMDTAPVEQNSVTNFLNENDHHLQNIKTKIEKFKLENLCLDEQKVKSGNLHEELRGDFDRFSESTALEYPDNRVDSSSEAQLIRSFEMLQQNVLQEFQRKLDNVISTYSTA